MKQRGFAIGATIARQRKAQRALYEALAAGTSPLLTRIAFNRARAARRNRAQLNARSQLVSSTTFNINSLSDDACFKMFRFRLKEISRISTIMSWVAGVTKRNRYRCDPLTASCIVLKKLSSPTRWVDIETIFGMHASAMSEVFWEVVQKFIEERGELLTTFRSNLLIERADMYAAAIAAKGAPLHNCVAFIDCTKVQICRPGGHGSLQRSCYSGHKRFHCLVYQTLTTPDGLMFTLYGPEAGRRHDTTLLRNSGLSERLQSDLVISGRQFCVYGDAAYMLRPWLQTAYPSVAATPEQENYNRKMSAVREAVEWTYKDIKQMSSSQDYKRLLRVRKAPIALLYIAAGLLWNFKVCLGHGGQTQSYSRCAPPTLERYLSR